MRWLIEKVQKVRTFLSDVHIELRKSTWPTPSELMESTIVLIISVVILAAFVGLSDTVLAILVRAIVQ